MPSIQEQQHDAALGEFIGHVTVLEALHEQDCQALAAREAQIEARDLQIKLLTEQLNLLRAEKFGPSAERFSPDQMALALNEAESLAATVPVTAPPASVTIPEHTRTARGHRKALPDHLPQVDVIHDLPEAEKVCAHDGTALTVIGADVSKQLDYVPAKVQVLVHKRLKYACPRCDQSIKTAPAAAQLLPKSNASPRLLAYIATAKYVDGTPLYRIERQFDRLHVPLPRVTQARWMIDVGQEKLQPLINLLHEHWLSHPVVHLDETPVQVLKSDKSVHSDHYMWVRCAGPPGRKIVLFEYDSSRSHAVPKRLLDGYQGALITDGYEAYDAALKVRGGIVHAGCWAHARRKYDAAKKAATNNGIEKSRAQDMLVLMGQLYGIERALKESKADDAERRRVRSEKSAPIVAAIKHWLETHQAHVLPKSLLGKALTYTQNQWTKLTEFLDHPNIPLDNNAAENVIRPFVIGRKNWLFCDTVAGAKASANLYSIVETAKANGLEPHAYLTRVFSNLPNAKTVEDIEALLPLKQGRE